MAEWVALPSISGGPHGPFRDLWGPGKGVVGGDFGARAGLGGAAAASAGLHKPLPGRCGAAAAQPGSGCCRGCTRCLGLPPLKHPPSIAPGGGSQLGDKARKFLPPPPPLNPGSPSVPPAQQQGQRWDHRAGCPSFPVALLSRSQRAVQ